MVEVLMVAIGGALGAVSRYLTTLFIKSMELTENFPLATFTCNILGCLLMGFLTVMITRRFPEAGRLSLLLTTGFLGAYTTFSTFSLESSRLFVNGFPWAALGNIVASVVAGVLAIGLGAAIARSIWTV